LAFVGEDLRQQRPNPQFVVDERIVAIKTQCAGVATGSFATPTVVASLENDSETCPRPRCPPRRARLAERAQVGDENPRAVLVGDLLDDGQAEAVPFFLVVT
jgi:hypothetical protein